MVAVVPAGCVTTPEPEQTPPFAYIDEISPSSPTAGEMVSFHGHGTDADGTVVGYRWRSSIDGDLSALSSFDAQLSPGNHVIYLMVQDIHGNWSDEVSSSIVVSDAAPTPTPDAEEPPVVNSLAATPGEIDAGGTSALAWDVSGAESVTIDYGIGSVSDAGVTVIAPADTTVYTLTATNQAGNVEVSAVVLVTAAPSPDVDKPDLVVTSITRDGSVISCTIKNQGTADAGPSNSRVLVDGVEKAAHSIASLPAGASRTESFSFTYECSGISDVVLVQVDKDNMVDESNETNNFFSTSWYCLLVIPDPGPAFPIVLKPALTVTNVWVSEGRIHYTIENIGAIAPARSTSELFVSGVPVASDTVPSIAAGEFLDRHFQYHFSCFLPMMKTVEVNVDTEDTNDESDELNNSMKVSLLCNQLRDEEGALWVQRARVPLCGWLVLRRMNRRRKRRVLPHRPALRLRTGGGRATVYPHVSPQILSVPQRAAPVEPGVAARYSPIPHSVYTP